MLSSNAYAFVKKIQNDQKPTREEITAFQSEFPDGKRFNFITSSVGVVGITVTLFSCFSMLRSFYYNEFKNAEKEFFIFKSSGYIINKADDAVKELIRINKICKRQGLFRA